MVQLVKNLPANAGDARCGFYPWVRKIPWRRKWQLASVFLLAESRGLRRLADYSPWGCRVGHSLVHAHMHILDIIDLKTNKAEPLHRKMVYLRDVYIQPKYFCIENAKYNHYVVQLLSHD